MKKLFLLIIIAQLFGACTEKQPSPPKFAEVPKVELHEVIAISEFNNGDFFARPFSVTPLPDGQFLISDSQTLKIHQFNNQFKYVGSIGREGKGPGEFRRLNNIFLKGDTISVVDARNYRISSYKAATDGLTLIAEKGFKPMSYSKYPLALFRQFIPSDDGSLTAVYYDFDQLSREEIKIPKILVYPYSETADEPVDSLVQIFNLMPEIHKERVILSIPYLTRGFFSSLYNGFVYAQNDQSMMKVYSTTGKIKMEIPLRGVKTELSPAAKEAAYYAYYKNSPDPERFKQDVISVMPDYRPVIKNLSTDIENRIWVQIYQDENNQEDWFVFGDDGTPQVNLKVDDNLNILNARGNRVYALRNAEEGPEIVILEWR